MDKTAHSGTFITFEGGEGAGKSTHVRILAAALGERGHAVVATREPGGTGEGEAVRALLVDGDPERWPASAEALLNYAARDVHLRRVIRPALGAGKVVLCDRFHDSTRAYQALAGDCPLALIEALEAQIVAPTFPALTFIFDLDAEAGLARAAGRGDGAGDRFERKGIEFHRRLRAGFLKIARANRNRCVVIDASQPVDAVSRQVLDAVFERFPKLEKTP